MESAIDCDDVASMVTTELATDVVVPNVDGVVEPETAPASCANAFEEILNRGVNVCDEILSEETST